MGKNSLCTEKSLVLHAFSDLSRTSPPVFVSILMHTYIPGNGKAVMKFQALLQQVTNALATTPPPGPATYVVFCLNALLVVDSPHSEALSHLLTSALKCLPKVSKPDDDAAKARILASQLCHSVIVGSITLGERVLVKLATVFGIQLKDLGDVMLKPALDEEEKKQKAKACLEPFIMRLIKSRLYSSAVGLLKQFSLQHSTPRDFLVAMVRDNQVEAAEQWAAYMGKHMICSLVQHCTEMSMFKKAYKIVEKYKLQLEFPDAYNQYRKSSLRKLVEKGCWDIAESIANEDRQFIEYLVVLAQEVGAATKAVDICHRHSLPCIPFCSVQGDGITETQYLQLPDIILAENVIWVDTTDGLADAARHFSEVKVVGIDCEWKPNYLKQETNKASILQIATGKRVFIFDLIKLFEEKRDALDDCLKLIFHSSNILKLGYSLHNDLEKLFRSYKDLMCFQLCESTLDLQTLSPSSKGGLSGLTKIILGRHLNKASQMTDWEQRPLSHIQLHYAALDAAVLLSIFDILSHEPLTLGGVEGQEISDWKSHVKCFRTKISPKKRSAVLEPKAHFVGSSTGKELDDDLNSSRTMHDQEDSPPGFYQESEVMVVSGPDSKAPLSCSSDMACALEEDLVYASCELLGLPKPGLLRSELQHYAHAERLPNPIYNLSARHGPGNIILFCCSVTIGGMKFYGYPASSKREAEIWAAIHALSHFLEGFFPLIRQSVIDVFHNHSLCSTLLQEPLLMQTKTDPSIHEDDSGETKLNVVPSYKHVEHNQKTSMWFATRFSACKCNLDTTHHFASPVCKIRVMYFSHLTVASCLPIPQISTASTDFNVRMSLQHISRKVLTGHGRLMPLQGASTQKTVQRTQSDFGWPYYHVSSINVCMCNFRTITASMPTQFRSLLHLF